MSSPERGAEGGPSAWARVLDLLTGGWRAQAIHVAARLGLADLLHDGPADASELARATGADADALHRLLRALATLEIFHEPADGRFSLTPLARLLRRDVPESIRPAAALVGQPFHWQAWGALFDAARTGKAGFEHVHGTRFFDYLAAHPKDGTARCRQVMSARARLLLIEMVVPGPNQAHPSKFMDLNMLVLNHGGRERTAAGFEHLLARAGLRLTRLLPTASALSRVEAAVASGEPAVASTSNERRPER